MPSLFYFFHNTYCFLGLFWVSSKRVWALRGQRACPSAPGWHRGSTRYRVGAPGAFEACCKDGKLRTTSEVGLLFKHIRGCNNSLSQQTLLYWACFIVIIPVLPLHLERSSFGVSFHILYRWLCIWFHLPGRFLLPSLWGSSEGQNPCGPLVLLSFQA